MDKKVLFFLIFCIFLSVQTVFTENYRTDTWKTPHQLIETSTIPLSPERTEIEPHRNIHFSIGRSQLQAQFSNEIITHVLTINSMYTASSTDMSSIDPGMNRSLIIQGVSAVAIRQGPEHPG